MRRSTTRPARLLASAAATLALLALLVPAAAAAQDDPAPAGAGSGSGIDDVFSLRLTSLGGGAYSSATGGIFDFSLLGLAWTWGLEIEHDYERITLRKTAKGLPLTLGFDPFNVQLGENIVFHSDVFIDKALAMDQGSDAWVTFSVGARTGLAISFVTDSADEDQSLLYVPLLAAANLRILLGGMSVFIELPIGPAFRLNKPSTVSDDDAASVVFLFFLKLGIALDS